MRYLKLIGFSLCLSLFPLLLISCATQPQETRVVLTSTETSFPQTPTPTEEVEQGTPVTSLDQIVGIWQGETKPGIFFVLSIQPDGMMKLSGSIEKLAQGHSDTYQIWIEDGRVSIDIPVFCPEGIGVYSGLINLEGNLDFTTIEDPCSYRISRFDRSMPEEFQQYDVEFHRLGDEKLLELPESCEEVDGSCLELSFDGNTCDYQGPDPVQQGPVTLIYFNHSEETSATNLIRLLEDKTIQDLIDYNGDEPTTKHHPTWSAEYYGVSERTEPGTVYIWRGELESGIHALVCIRILPVGVWLGGGFSVVE